VSWLSRLFGRSGTGAPAPAAVIHEGFEIVPTPIREGAVFRVAAEIRKEVDGEMRAHRMIRADTCPTEKAASDLAVRKARMLIDQMGEGILS